MKKGTEQFIDMSTDILSDLTKLFIVFWEQIIVPTCCLTILLMGILFYPVTSWYDSQLTTVRKEVAKLNKTVVYWKNESERDYQMIKHLNSVLEYQTVINVKVED